MDFLKEETWMKFLTGQCTVEELRAVKGWMDSDNEHAKQLFEVEQLYSLGKHEAHNNETRLNIAEKALMKRLNRSKAHYLKLRHIYVVMRYAAMLVGVVLMGTLGYLFYQVTMQNENLIAVAATDQIKQLVLPDGTKVWLNKNTTFRYPAEFSENGRTVYLEGEGYFEVEKNPRKPFVVKSDAMQVRVLGTKFNLKSDKEHKSAEATLMQGEIEVRGNHEEGQVILSPGQKAELDGVSKRLVVRQVDGGIDRWHNNTFSFENSDIFTIVRTLERSYGVDIVLSSDIDVSKTYSGAVKKKSCIEEVLQLIQLTIPIDFEIKGQIVTLRAKK